MKNFKLSVLTLLVLIVTGLVFVSCFNESDGISNRQNISPALIGKLHNEALNNIFENEENFDFNATEEGLKVQILEKNNLFLFKKIKLLNISDESKVNNLEISKGLNLLNTDELLSVNFENITNSRTSFSLSESTIFEKIDFLYVSNVILDEDKIQLYTLFQAYKDNYDGLLSNEALINIVRNIKQSYIENNSDNSITNVFVTLSILEICTNSLEWFDENINNFGNKRLNRRVPIAPIVAADAIGAVVGIAEGIVASAVINGTNSPVDGESVVVGALISAATTSIGAGVKALGWFAKLF